MAVRQVVARPVSPNRVRPFHDDASPAITRSAGLSRGGDEGWPLRRVLHRAGAQVRGAPKRPFAYGTSPGEVALVAAATIEVGAALVQLLPPPKKLKDRKGRSGDGFVCLASLRR